MRTMAASNLTWYKTKASRILKFINAENQTEMSTLLNIKQQTYSYRIRNVYPRMLEDLLRLLDVAGFEVVEKETFNDR